MSDDDSPLEEDEEEFLVYVDFEGITGQNTFLNENLQLDMLGLDMEHPIMQVNGKYYEGTYEDAVGTYMFFEKDNNPVIDDPVFDKVPALKYFEKTKKILKMKRVFVKPRLEVLGDSDHPGSTPNLETLKEAGVPPKYQYEALKLWEQMRGDRLRALNEYLEKQRLRKQKRMQGIEPDSESDDDNPFAMYKYNQATESLSLDDQDKDDDPDNFNFYPDKLPYDPLAVIDPGPSTSKNSVPWTSPPRDPLQGNADQANHTTRRIRNEGHIEVLHRRRVRAKLKTIKKTKPLAKKATKKTVKNKNAGKADGKNHDVSNEAMEVDEEINTNVENEPEAEVEAEEEEEVRAEVVVEATGDGERSLKDNIIRDIKPILEEALDEALVCQSVEGIQITTDTTSTENQGNTITEDELNERRLKEKQRRREEKMKEITERLRKTAEEMKSRVN